MSPWTALLESMHSALIDEITSRHPDPKPELGLPMRRPKFEFPQEGLASALCAGVDFGQPPSGCMALSLCPEAEKRLGLDALSLWESLIQRTGAEFSRRGIQPRLGAPMKLATQSSTGSLPPGFTEPERMVWIPIKVGQGSVFLGMGV